MLMNTMVALPLVSRRWGCPVMDRLNRLEVQSLLKSTVLRLGWTMSAIQAP